YRPDRDRRRRYRRHRSPDVSRLPLPRRFRGGDRNEAASPSLVSLGQRLVCAGRAKLGRVAPVARGPSPTRAQAETDAAGRMSAVVLVERGPLAALGRALLGAAGATPEHAGVVIDHLIEAD